MKRPLFVLGMTFGASLLAARVMGFRGTLTAAALSALFLILALAIRSLRRNTTVLAVLLAAAAAFFMSGAREYLVVRPLQALDGQTVTATVWLTEEQTKNETAILYTAVVQGGDLPQGTKLLLRVADWEEGPELYNLGEARLYLQANNTARSDGIYLYAWAQEDWTVTLTARRPWDAGLTAWRQRMTARTRKWADGEAGALIRAVCFGDKSGLTPELKEAFSRAGLSHLTAVSGFHMSVVALGVFRLLRRCGLHRRWAALCSLPVPAAFAALCGFPYSALRAGVMCLLLLLAEVTRRKSDAKNSLGGAVLLILLADPNAVWDVGFLLSVSATMGIVCAAGWGARRAPAQTLPPGRRAGRKLWDALRVTLTALAATLPVLALTFEELSLASPVSNLLGEPAAAGIVTFGCVGTLLAAVPGLSFLAAPCFLIAGLLARGLLWWTRCIAALPVVMSLNHPYLLLWACAVPFALWLGWRLLRGRGLRLCAMLLVVALCAANLGYTLGMRGVTTLTAEWIADGMALLLARDGHYGLICTGGADSGASFLFRQGVDRLDFVLYTEAGESPAPPGTKVDTVFCAGAGVPDGAVLTFWGDGTARLRENWLTIEVGGWRVVLCPSDGDAAALPREERWADYLIFDTVPPQNAALFAVGEALLCCGEDLSESAVRQTPWGVYPVTVAQEAASIPLRPRSSQNLSL